jgi:hypothetical protein
MPLFTVNFLVRLQDLLVNRQEGINLGTTRLTQTVTWRFRVRQNLLQRLPVNIVLSARAAFTDLTDQNTTADFHPLLHLREHPSLAAFKFKLSVQKPTVLTSDNK